MNSINEMTVRDLQLISVNDKDLLVVFGLNTVPMLQIQLSLDGLLDLSTAGHGLAYEILNHGSSGKLAPDYHVFACGVPMPTGHSVDSFKDLLRNPDQETLRKFMVATARIFKSRRTGTQQGTFKEFQGLAQDIADLSRTTLLIELPASMDERSQVVAWAKRSGPTEMRASIRAMLDWFLPSCGSVLMHGTLFSYEETKLTFIARERTGHELIEAGARVRAFLERAKADLGMDADKVAQIERQCGIAA